MSTVLELLTPILEHTPGGVEHDQQRHAGGRGSESRGVDFIDNPNGQNIKMLRNPSVGQAIAAFHKSESSYRAGNIKQLRGITSGKNIWIWNAHKGTHADAAEALGLDYLEANSRNGLLTMNTEQHVRFYFGKMADGSDPFPATESIRDLLEHFGPGPHKSGSEQSAHGGGGGDVDPRSQIPTNQEPRDVVTETSIDNADVMISQGLRPDFKPQIAQVQTFAPGRGVERNATYVAEENAFSRGSFGNVRIHVKAPAQSITLPVEQTQLGVTNVNVALANENGAVIGKELKTDAITKIEVYRGGSWHTVSRDQYLKERGIEAIPRLPSVDEYRTELEKRAEQLFLSPSKVDAAVHNYNRNNLQDKWFEIQDFKQSFGAFTESLCAFLEHMGPGPHPSGSPQAEHAGGGGGFPSSADIDKKLSALKQEEKESRPRIRKTAKQMWKKVEVEQRKYDELDRRNVKLGEKLDEIDATVREMHDHDSMVRLKKEEIEQVKNSLEKWEAIGPDEQEKFAEAQRRVGRLKKQLEHSKAQLQGMRDEAVKKTTAAFIAGNKLDKLRDERREVQNMMAEQDDRIRNATQTAEVFELSENEGKPLGRLAENLRAKNGNQGLLDSMRKDMGGAKDAIMSQPHVSASARVQGGVYGDGEIRASQELRGEIKKGIVENVSGGLIAKADASDISNASADIVAVREAGGRYNADAMEHAGILRDQKKGRSNIDHARVVSQNIVDSWAKSSTNGNATSVAMQIAVKRKFGDREAIKGMAEATSTEGFELYSNNRKVFDALADSIYEDTQAKLKAAGVDEVTLFRGMSLSRDEVGEDVVYHLGQKNFAAMDVDIDMNPISSFSTHYGDAKTFSSASNKDYGSLTAVRVPRKRIFCTAFNGLGCVTEAEVLVTGEAPLHGKIMVGESYAAQSLSTYFDWLNQKGLQVSE